MNPKQSAVELFTEHARQNSEVYEPSQFEQAPKHLTETQLTALDLYERGFNVMPIKLLTKESFLNIPFFTSRLHHCGVMCKHKGQDDITELFHWTNLGVMTGRTSGNLLDIDCDSYESFVQMGKDLAARNLPFWAITGHSGGGYLLRLKEGEAANRAKDPENGIAYCSAKHITQKTKFSDVEFFGNCHYLVMPPSIHPLRDLYRWASPEPRFHLARYQPIEPVSITALDWLGVELRSESHKQWQEPDLYGLPRWAAALNRSSRETFGGNLREGERNKRLFYLACDLKAHEREYHEAENILLDVGRRVGLSDSETLHILKSAYSKPRAKGRPDGGGVRTWQRAKDFASSFDWRGKFGRKANGLQAAYLACVERCRRDGKEPFRAAWREIAELANTSAKRAGERLQGLMDAKLIQRIEVSKTGGLFRFVGLSRLTPLYTTGSSSGVSLDTPKTQGEQDVFGRLGLVSWHVWRYLLYNPAPNAAMIASETGLPRSSVYAALKRLQHDNVRLVTRSGDGMYYGEPSTEASLQSMALFWDDGFSRSAHRKEMHRIERERRVNRLVRDAMRREGWKG